MNIDKNLQSKIFKAAVLAAGCLIIFLFGFKAGQIVGFKKAAFSYKWGENYHKNFGGPKQGFFQEFSGRDFINANGIFGKIIKINQPNASSTDMEIVIENPNAVENVIVIKKTTQVVKFRDIIRPAGLQTDDLVVVIGEPNDNGQIEAKLIRVMPAPPMGMQFDIVPKRLNKF